MNKKNFVFYRYLHRTPLILTIFLAGCQWWSCQKPENLAVAHEKVVHYYETGCFARELAEVVKKAKCIFSKPAENNRQVIVCDIDETIMSDYCRIKSIQFGYIPKLSHAWVVRASAPAIPEMKDLYDYLIGKGYKFIFLTGRHADEYDATLQNLRSEGFTSFEQLIVRPAELRTLTAIEYKSRMREKLVAEGWEIVGTIGDQWSDLTGPFVGKTIKIPNYMYEIK